MIFYLNRFADNTYFLLPTVVVSREVKNNRRFLTIALCFLKVSLELELSKEIE